MTKPEFDDLIMDVKQIKQAVVGDTKWGQKGLIKRVELLESWKDSVNLKTAFYSGSATVVVLVVGKLIEHIWK